MVAFAFLESRNPIGQPLHVNWLLRRPRTSTCLVTLRRIEIVVELLRVERTTWSTSQLEDLVSVRRPGEGALGRWDDDIASVATEVDSGPRGAPRALLAVPGCWGTEVPPAARRPDGGCPTFMQPGPLAEVILFNLINRAVHVDVHHDKARGSASRHPDIC